MTGYARVLKGRLEPMFVSAGHLAGLTLYFFTTDSAHTRAASLYLAGVLVMLASSRPSFKSTLTIWKSLVRAKQHARFWWVRVFGLAIALAGMVLLMRMEETTGLEEILIMFVLAILFYERIVEIPMSTRAARQPPPRPPTSEPDLADSGDRD